MILVEKNNSITGYTCQIVEDSSKPAVYGVSGKIFYSLDMGILRNETIFPENRMSIELPKIIMLNPWTYWGDNTKLESIRLQRNYLLSQTDWTALNDVPLSPEEKTAYENYRQQLRDFPDVVDLDLPIEQIIWPTKP